MGDWSMYLTLGITLSVFAMMLWEKLPVDQTALLGLCALLVTGVLSPEEAFQVFSNEAVITVASMFVLSAALDRTGAIDQVGRWVNRIPAKNEFQLLCWTLPIVALCSAFINNTPVVVVFMPVLIGLASRRGWASSKLLMPLSFAAIFGGTCTLIGTSTNILISATARSHGEKPLGMFELAPIGLVLTLAGLIYLLTWGWRQLPNRETLSSLIHDGADMKEYLSEAVILEDSPLVGKKLTDKEARTLNKVRLLDVLRYGEPVAVPLNELVLQAGDQLRVVGGLDSVIRIKEAKGVEFQPNAQLGLEPVGQQKARIVETVIGPNSELLGKTVRQINFRQMYGALILAIHRHGVNIRQNFEQVRLRFGDTLLLEGSEASIQKLSNNRNFLLLSDPALMEKRVHRAWIAVLVTALVIVFSQAQSFIPFSGLAFTGATMVTLLGCLDTEDAYRAIQWRVIFLILGTLGLGVALEKTGGAAWLAAGILKALGDWGPRVALSGFIFLALSMTVFISNNAVAVLLTPIAISAAHAMNVDARPFLIGIAVGASASFATPVGYQTNSLIYSAGGYLFRDFIRVGGPLTLIFWALGSWLIPILWSF